LEGFHSREGRLLLRRLLLEGASLWGRYNLKEASIWERCLFKHGILSRSYYLREASIQRMCFCFSLRETAKPGRFLFKGGFHKREASIQSQANNREGFYIQGTEGMPSMQPW
jgi:hypothetical protein